MKSHKFENSSVILLFEWNSKYLLSNFFRMKSLKISKVIWSNDGDIVTQIHKSEYLIQI